MQVVIFRDAWSKDWHMISCILFANENEKVHFYSPDIYACQ